MKLALYDFDGTLYKGDTSIDFCFFIYKRNFLRSIYFPYQVFLYLSFSLGLLSVEKFKERFYIFLKGISPAQLEELLQVFWEKKFPLKFNSELLQIINKQKNNLTKVVCISATPSLFLLPLTERSGIDMIIGTDLYYKNKIYRIKGKNCRGYEKVNRLRKEFDLNQVNIVQAYGDNKYDVFMLGLADESFLVSGNKIVPINSENSVNDEKS